MTTAPSRLHRLATFAGLSVALIGTCLLPAGARAAGFSGSFDPANWSIVNTTAGAIDQTLSGSGIPPAYTCGSPTNDVACAENVDAINGGVDVVGSVAIAGFNGGGTANTVRTTTWTVTNGAQSSVLSFSWALATLASSTATNQRVSYLIGAIETPISSTAGDAGSLTNITVGASETFGFRVTTDDNISDYGVLTISSFDAVNSPASVPGPLPLAGGIAAFSWSRRLRRRIRQRNS